MKHYLTTLHNELCKPYGKEGEKIFGKATEMHPLVQEMLLHTSPHYVRGDNYNAFIEALAKNLKERGKTIETAELKDIITPKDLHRFMKLFTQGMQYVAKKTNGECEAKTFKFLCKLDGKASSTGEFGAAYNPHEQIIAINPYYVLHWKQSAEESERNLSDIIGAVLGYFRSDEEVILAGIEEMYHSHQITRLDTIKDGDKAFYQATSYLDDPLEKDAKDFLGLAVREMHLGSYYRHQLDTPKPQVHYLNA